MIQYIFEVFFFGLQSLLMVFGIDAMMDCLTLCII